jgi:hypothetical protein
VPESEPVVRVEEEAARAGGAVARSSRGSWLVQGACRWGLPGRETGPPVPAPRHRRHLYRPIVRAP